MIEKDCEELLESERAARRAAEDANRAKDEFLAVLSHELRTPLNAMYGWVRMLASNSLDAAMQRRAVEVLERNIQLQSKLIEDVLDVSRIVSGKLKLESQPLDLTALVRSTVETQRPDAESKHLSLVVKAEHNVAPTVLGDAERLQQIFNNLIGNAIKFTAKNGEIKVSIEQTANAARVVVSDNGIGINSEFLPFVFERFRQADASSKRTHGGLGLGLAIVKSLVELHNGTIAAHSDGENQGATFTVELPLISGKRKVESGK